MHSEIMNNSSDDDYDWSDDSGAFEIIEVAAAVSSKIIGKKSQREEIRNNKM